MILIVLCWVFLGKVAVEWDTCRQESGELDEVGKEFMIWSVWAVLLSDRSLKYFLI